MDKLLYIQASPLKEESFSIRAADSFLEKYQQVHPGDTVHRLNLFDADLPPFDGVRAKAKVAIMQGEKLAENERKAWDDVENLINQFKQADKYVFAVPMWNFSIPYALKLYIDHIVQPGYTFDPMGEKGNTGLVKNKSAFVAYARGGEYRLGSEGDPFDHQKSYLEAVFNFIGLKDVSSVVVQPTLSKGIQIAEETLQKAQQTARELALTF